MNCKLLRKCSPCNPWLLKRYSITNKYYQKIGDEENKKKKKDADSVSIGDVEALM